MNGEYCAYPFKNNGDDNYFCVNNNNVLECVDENDETTECSLGIRIFLLKIEIIIIFIMFFVLRLFFNRQKPKTRLTICI